jgi:uncharacterized protein (DUF58 family)
MPSDFAALLDALHGARWPARAAVRSGIPGAHGSRRRGTSVEFTEYRPYAQGDDPGRIDWRLFARSDRAYIRLSNDRAVLPTTIVLDASASMAFPLATLDKWRLATEVGVGLAAVARSAADPVGLIVARDGQSIHLPPRARPGVIHELIRAVQQVEPGGAEPLAASLSAAARVSGRIVVVSDFLGDVEELTGASAAIVASGREVHAVHVVAAAELDPPPRAALVSDPEEPTLRRALTDESRRVYRSAFAAWRDRLAHDLSDAGVSYTMAVTDGEEADHLVRRIAAPRNAASPA